MRPGGCRCSSARMSLPCPVDRRMCTAEVHSSGRPLVNRNWHTCVAGEERAGLGHAARYAVGIQQSAIWEQKTRSRRPAVASRRECRRPRPRGRRRWWRGSRASCWYITYRQPARLRLLSKHSSHADTHALCNPQRRVGGAAPAELTSRAGHRDGTCRHANAFAFAAPVPDQLCFLLPDGANVRRSLWHILPANMLHSCSREA